VLLEYCHENWWIHSSTCQVQASGCVVAFLQNPKAVDMCLDFESKWMDDKILQGGTLIHILAYYGLGDVITMVLDQGENVRRISHTNDQHNLIQLL